MAALQLRNGRYRVIFRYHGKQYVFTIGDVSKDEAEAKSAHVEYLLMRLKQGLIELPPRADIVNFVQFDGQKARKTEVQPARKSLTLAELRDRYVSTFAAANEGNTLTTSKIHFKHFATTLGAKFPLVNLSPPDLQRHIDRRVKTSISAVTIAKEIATLRAAWNWAQRTGLLTGAFPNQGLVFPKTEEKPPFQTMAEILRQIRRARLGAAEQEALWECVFLTQPEIAELLDYVQKQAVHGWIYPMLCFAAHTGARRSELLRAQIADVDFEGETVIIRERKRQKGRRTSRRAPLSPFLAGVLKAWLVEHPGGTYLFCHCDEVDRSRIRSRTTVFVR